MRGKQTKEGRLKIQQAQIESLLNKGWIKDTYKGLTIMTENKENNFSLKVFRDAVSEPLYYYLYKTEEQRTKRIEDTKIQYDRNIEYKAKNPPRQTGAAACSAAIKTELQKVFPGVKFSVRSSNFSMGDSVFIDWQDGPIKSEVEKITGKYQYGHFNGMEDIYENTNSRDDIPQSKYVMENRKMSAETAAILRPFAEEIFNLWPEDSRVRDASDIVYQLFVVTNFFPGTTVKGIEKTDCTCGNLTDFYKITFEGEAVKEVQRPAKVETIAGKIDIIKYSDKSIAVIGDTKPVKDKLKSLGGSFNFRLTCGPGWIFPLSKLADIQNSLSTV